MDFKFTYNRYNTLRGTGLSLNMGVCILFTGLIAVAAVLSCILMLFCIKFATMRDEEQARKNGKDSVTGDKRSSVAEPVAVISGDKIAPFNPNDRAGMIYTSIHTDGATAEERTGLTSVAIVDENDM